VADLDRARRWLRQHRLGDIEPTPLLAARLAARRRAKFAEVITVVVGTSGMLAWMLAADYRGTSGDSADLFGLVWQVSFNIALILGMAAGFWWQRREERPLLQGMAVRTAHPEATSATRVLGQRRVRTALAINVGGVATGAAVALLAPDGADRALALAFLLGVAVLAGLGALALNAVLRRPSVAEDSASLAVDDALRVEDGRRALVPYALLIAVIVAVNTTASSWAIWPFLGYAVAGVAGYVFGERCRERVAVAA
jgi:hypothetical protein